MGDSEVDRILKARNHFHVLGFESVDYVDIALVRKQYKALARQVHPDKCSHKDAENAFKRLSEAYECLANETTQYEHLAKCTGSKKRPRPPQRKASASSQPPKAPTRRPTRLRTADEIYADFLREEERQAEMEFLKRGFERTYDTSRDERAPSPPPLHSETFIDDMLSSGLETKQAKWSQFAKPSRTAAPPTQAPAAAVALSSPPATNLPSSSSTCCLLCRRKFMSAAQLARHESESKLHAENLAQAQQPSTTTKDQTP
ncbi:Aste57867_16627 [Aphanomyces stellatus]|uniref:Aste57867_16627 protein n=1 Tax=Aphanomyces stellatus TaxID=120398 RepID=A0A485L638_9STRA|nr:hypothetical protein As57867_016570 [Aphanomyces stellatus]VFT93398.1 Aste57867_16627 [Aphanomyces stellatus]